MEFLTGKDYPHLCDGCQSVVDRCVEAVVIGPDTDDEEAPLMLAGDNGLLCDQEMGGTRCAHLRQLGCRFQGPNLTLHPQAWLLRRAD